jgi:CubicO group peptidase (beta-lactamase class C family)
MTSLQTDGLRDFATGKLETRGLGWYVNMDGNPKVGEVLSWRTFMHGGATTTWLAIDPERNLIIVMLANRLGVTETEELQARLARAVVDDLS